MTGDSVWRGLEQVPGLVAVPAQWRRLMGRQHEAFVAACLRRSGGTARSVPCPHECGCAHEVVRHASGRIVGVCQCESWNCDDMPLQPHDVELWEVNWSKLGRAIARALDCEFKEADLGLPQTRQIAVFGGAALPVVLTIRHGRDEFRNVLGELVIRLRERFIVLAPTNRWVDANTQALLRDVNAGFCDLESHVMVLPSGVLNAPRKGGELFSRFLPEQVEAVTEGEWKRILRLFGELLAMGTELKASPARVFDLMVFKKQSKAQTAVACKCAASLITKRVNSIEQHFQKGMEELVHLGSDLQERLRTVKGDRYAKKKWGPRRDELEPYDEDKEDSAPEEEYGCDSESPDD